MATVRFDNITKSYRGGVTAVDKLNLEIGEGEFLILVGPSGCGKTTALRMLAGLEEITSGKIHIGDRVVNQLPPPERDIAMVFQNYALYPHMSVFDNIAFPLEQQKVKKSELRKRVQEVASLLSIDEYLGRKPRELSGGQRQRVAIGRALIRRPQAFLMDEPLSNLDAKLRVQMRAELINLHQQLAITTIYVTHDQTEAMTLGDRVVVMNRGVVQQADTPENLYRRPSNIFVAGFIGSPAMNFFDGEIDGGAVRLGAYVVELPESIQQRLQRTRGAVLVGLRPEDFLQTVNGGPSIPAEIQITERLGPEVLVHLRAAGLATTRVGEQAAKSRDEESGELSETIIARFDSDFALPAGQRVTVGVNPERVQLFDPDTGLSLVC